MTDVRVVEEIVTKFFLDTCLLRPRLSPPAVQAVLRGVELASTVHGIHNADADLIALTTGSVAEFYIEPMLPLVSDVDVMYYCSTELAIPRGHPAPTRLPAEFHNNVQVHEIIDSHFPGYVYLELRYLLTECIDDGKYNAVEYEEQLYLRNGLYLFTDAKDIHGPAVISGRRLPVPMVPIDSVRCVRCLVWPSEAADWPTRRRNYGWPDSATVDCVVGNGCDVVPVAHRQCRQHKWMGNYQWRLSFSRAEIVLINSWMPAQQIVYHMLRLFAKTERLTYNVDSCETVTLNNYHIKTLMLWACELKSSSWRTDDLNVVRVCVRLLHSLGDWLTDAWCQHYFISNCNLIENSFEVTNIRIYLMAVDEAWLSKWFVDNYI